MAKWRMRVWCALLICISIIACAFSRVGCQMFFDDESVACVIYDGITDSAHQKIEQYLSEHKNIKANSLLQKIHEQFPFLHDLSVYHLPSKILQCTAHLEQPLYIFNDQIVMTDTGNLASKDVFNDTLLQALPHITIDDISWLEHERYAFFTTIALLSPSIWSDYIINFKNQHDVQLHLKNDVTPIMRFSFDQLADESLLDNALKAWQDYHSRPEKKRAQKMIVDVRFDNQVVLYEQTERES